jgi:hypothetical protein
MRSAALLAGSLVLGTVGGLAGASLATSSRSRATSIDPTPGDPEADRDAVERLERRLDDLAATVNAPSLAPAPAVPAPPPRRDEDESRSDGRATAASADRIEALERRVTALEGRGPGGTPVPADLSQLSVSQLEALVRNLTAERRGADAVKVAEGMLRRTDLTPSQRIDAEMSIGYALRSQGKNAEAETRFRESLLRVGDDSEKAPWLGFQIAWERKYQSDLQGGIAEMEKAANHARVEPLVRVHALYNAASFAREAGETARAQAFLERLLTQHADKIPPSQANMKAQAEAWLKEIRGN